LLLVWHGVVKRLIINMPPRSLKLLVSLVAFPAFTLGHDPSLRIVTVSYGSELALGKPKPSLTSAKALGKKGDAKSMTPERRAEIASLA
jgi:hypothetical protein